MLIAIIVMLLMIYYYTLVLRVHPFPHSLSAVKRDSLIRKENDYIWEAAECFLLCLRSPLLVVAMKETKRDSESML